jgi:membrane-anchored protein YejM (alkaline phosphatase superfamily)
MTAAKRGAASAETRWDHWQGRYERSSRRRARQARIIAVVIFTAILANLLIQLWARRA